MAHETKITYVAALILKAIEAGHGHGFDIMDAVGLPSGTVYPALRRLETAELIGAEWESVAIATAEGRPARRNYRLTAEGANVLQAAETRFRLPAFDSTREVPR